jgi:DNA-binding NtrC family response regulator
MARRVLVASRDSGLVDGLTRCLAPDLEVSLAATREQFDRHLKHRTFWAIVLDLSNAVDLGRPSVQTLRSLSFDGHDSASVVVVAPDPCDPELDELIDSVAVGRFKPPVAIDGVAGLLRCMRDEEVDHPAGRSRTLVGLTRSFVTYTPQLFPMLDELELVASHDVTILLIGETGSGKTFLSQIIHELSPRHATRFVPLACGTLPPDLIESELFGHTKGSFTGAHADKVGKFAAAGDGTLLLDEIDVLGLEQQVKLLRVIETGEFEPVGSNCTENARARLIVASNRELEPLVQQGKFRADLYYRLDVLKFHIPPLRRRKLDIVPLAKQFVGMFSDQHHVTIGDVEPEFFAAILAHNWPGNIRELENAVRRAVILCRNGRLSANQLPPAVLLSRRNEVAQPVTAQSQGSTLDHYVAMTEREIIEDALRKNRNRKSEAARSLGISRVTLYNKMRKYGMLRPTRPTPLVVTGSEASAGGEAV